MSNVLLSLIVSVAYGVLAAYFWRAQARGEENVLIRGAMGHLVLIPLVLHGYLLAQNVFANGGFNLSMTNALSLIIWLTLLVYSVARFFYPIGGLQALVLPLAAVTALLPEFFSSGHQLEKNSVFAF